MVVMVTPHQHPAVISWYHLVAWRWAGWQEQAVGLAMSQAVCPGTGEAVVTAHAVLPQEVERWQAKSQGPSGKVMVLWRHGPSRRPAAKELLM